MSSADSFRQCLDDPTESGREVSVDAPGVRRDFVLVEKSSVSARGIVNYPRNHFRLSYGSPNIFSVSEYARLDPLVMIGKVSPLLRLTVFEMMSKFYLKLLHILH